MTATSTHILDRPVWSALATTQAEFAEGSPLARRYPPSIVPFAAAADTSPESLNALAALPAISDIMVLVEAAAPVTPVGLDVVAEGLLVQMLAERPFERVEDRQVQELKGTDAADMLDLATLTKPGPFTLKSQSLGTFWGIRIGGRLVAMAGQRMRQPGFTELSGLCVHPDFQGQGLGKLMFRFVAGKISARNDVVYLHAYKSNDAAVGLYRSMGFSIRSDMHMRIVRKAA